MSVDTSSYAMIGCGLGDIDASKEDRRGISLEDRIDSAKCGLVIKRGENAFSGNMGEWVIGLDKYVVYKYESGSQHKVLSRDDLVAAYDETKKSLELFRLWNEKRFGIWSCLSIS